MLERNGTNYLNEPYATGGNPVLAGKDVLFNDLLGTTQGSISQNGKYQPTSTTAFGAGDKSAFFTGKPYVEGLGSVFLFRNYRPELSKWTSSDPLGYPDGWNNLAYCNNKVLDCFDWQGAATQTIGDVTWTWDWSTATITGISLTGSTDGGYTGDSASVTWKVAVSWNSTSGGSGSYDYSKTVSVSNVPWTKASSPITILGISVAANITTEGISHITNSRPSSTPDLHE